MRGDQGIRWECGWWAPGVSVCVDLTVARRKPCAVGISLEIRSRTCARRGLDSRNANHRALLIDSAPRVFSRLDTMPMAGGFAPRTKSLVCGASFRGDGALGFRFYVFADGVLALTLETTRVVNDSFVGEVRRCGDLLLRSYRSRI